MGTPLVGTGGITRLRTPGRPRLCPAGLRLGAQQVLSEPVVPGEGRGALVWKQHSPLTSHFQSPLLTWRLGPRWKEWAAFFFPGKLQCLDSPAFASGKNLWLPG